MSQSQTIKLVDGRQIGIAEYGDPNGMPIFYFHGFPGSRLEASRFHEAALVNRYRLIGIDRPGLGLSSIDKNSTILSWATDVANVADLLSIKKFSIIGYSGGAPFAAACAYCIPECLNGVAIVSGVAPFEKPETRIGMARGQRMAVHLMRTMPWLSKVMMKLTQMMLKNSNNMMTHMVKQLPEVDRAFLRDPEIGKVIIKNTIEAFRNGIAGPAREINLIINPWGFNLENIKYPIAFWQGTLDTQVPVSNAKIYASLIPNAQLKIFENEGHLSLITNHIQEILNTISPQSGEIK